MRNASLGDFVVVRTSQSVLTQTQIVEYSLLHTQTIWYSLLLLGHKPVQQVTVLNTVGNCSTMVSIIILYDSSPQNRTRSPRRGAEVTSALYECSFTPGKNPLPIVQEARWSPGPVWTGAENLDPNGLLSPDRPARRQSLYRLSYPGPHNIMIYYNITGPPPYMQSVVDRNVFMWRITLLYFAKYRP